MPHSDECLFIRRFRAADENAGALGYPAYFAHLTADRLWLTSSLCIPLSAIRSLTMIRKHGLLNQNALRIIYLDPDTGRIDAVHLCDMNFVGIYPVRRLQELAALIESFLAESGASSQLDDSVAQHLPEKDGYFRLFAKTVTGTFGSRDDVCQQLSTLVARSPAQNAGTDELSRLLTPGSFSDLDEEIVPELVRTHRMISGWKLFWQYLAPAVVSLVFVLGYLRLDRLSGWTPGAMTAALFAGAIAYALFAAVGSIIKNIFFLPFLLICKKVFGAKITIIHK